MPAVERRRTGSVRVCVPGRLQALSDTDVLITFGSPRAPGLFGIVRMERELAERFGGRVDPVTRPAVQTAAMRSAGGRYSRTPGSSMRGDQAAYLLDGLVAARNAVELVKDLSYPSFTMDRRTQLSDVQSIEVI